MITFNKKKISLISILFAVAIGLVIFLHKSVAFKNSISKLVSVTQSNNAANSVDSSGSKASGDNLRLSSRPQATINGRPNQSSLESEVLTISAQGLQPSNISRPEGRFLLVVDNRSGLNDLSLRLTAVGETKSQKLSKITGKNKWKEFLTLKPGKYVLTVNNHADWNSHINIADE